MHTYFRRVFRCASPVNTKQVDRLWASAFLSSFESINEFRLFDTREVTLIARSAVVYPQHEYSRQAALNL